MTPLVVDASVAVKWFMPQDHSDRALALRTAGYQLIAPDLIYAEFANALWKYARAGDLSTDDALGIVHRFQQIPLQVRRSTVVLSAALRLAVASGSSVYDALYLALAAAWNCHLVTADKRLIARFSRVDGFGEIAQWIGDL